MTEPALGRAVLELSTDSTKLNTGLDQAKVSANALGGNFKAAGQDAQKFGTTLSGVGQGAQQAGKLITGAFAQFTLAGLATQAISSLSSELGGFISTGAKLPAVEASFARLTSSMKQDGAAMLANMNAATRGVVSNYDLMLSANKAMLLGLPITDASMGELAKTATILGKAMGQDATKSLDDLITALGRSSPMILDNLGLTVKVGEANEAYAEKLGKSASALTESEKKMAFYAAAMEAAKRKTDELGDQTITLGEIAQSVWARIGDEVSQQASRINNAFGPEEQAYAAKFFATLSLDTKRAAEDFKDLGRWIDTALGKMDKLPTPGATKKPAPAGVDLPNLSTADLLAIGDGLDRVRESHNKGAAAAKKHADEVQALAAKYSGAALATQVRDLSAAMRGLGADANFKLLADDIGKLFDQGAKLTPEMMQLAIAFGSLNPPIVSGIANMGMLGQKFQIAVPTVRDFTRLLPDVVSGIDNIAGKLPKLDLQYQFSLAKPKVKDLTTSLGELSQSLANLSQIAGGSLGAMAGGLATLVGSLQTARKGVDAMKAGFAAAKGGEALSGIASMASGIGGIVAAAMAAVQAIKMIWSALDRNKGRDVVVDFAETFGGFDALHVRLLELGDAGEALWVKLTQGVGRNNPAQAERVIAEVEAALAKQAATADAASVATEAGAQATIETATQAALALDELNARLGTNREHWSAWSDHVTGTLQALADTIRALPVPSFTMPAVTTGTAGGSSSSSMFMGGGAPSSRASAPIEITVVSQLDGRAIARNQIRHTPNALASAGVRSR